jgi:hypothetical protein
LRTCKGGDEVDGADEEDAFDWSREGRQVEGTGVELFPASMSV